MPEPRSPVRPTETELMQPLDLSHLCDGQRTDFPLDIEVDAVKVMLDGVYLEQDLDYLLGRKRGQSVIEFRRAPRAGASVMVMRVPAPAGRRQEAAAQSAIDDVPSYDQLPQLVKDNISAEQWPAARRGIVGEGATIPETSDYINLKNGQIHTRQAGETAEAPLLAAHDLAGGGGRDDAQFRTAPRGTQGVS